MALSGWAVVEGGGRGTVNGALGVGWWWGGGGGLSRNETKVIIRQLSAQRHRPAHGEPVTGGMLVWTDW